MNTKSTQTLALLAILVFGFGAIFGLSRYVESVKPTLPEGVEDEDLALQASKLKGYSLGLEGLLADWYWMKSLQYLGDKFVKSNEKNIDIGDLRPLNPRLLYPLLDAATTLDPKFMAAYSYGAVVLPAIDGEQAIKIAEKGIKENPNEWRFYHQLGYIYWRMKNYEKASELYEQGSNIPNSPPFMKSMVANLKNQGGSRETAREIYKQLFNETDDKQVKENAQIKLLELDSLDEREMIRPILKEFKEKNGRCVNNFRELLPLLQNVKLPNNKDFRVDKNGNLVDPTDALYILNKETCDIQLDPEKSKLPLP